MNSRLKELRKSLGYTQAEFGSRIGLSRDEVSNVEIGRSPLRANTIPVICSVLGVNRAWLETGEGQMFVSSETGILNRLSEEFHLSKSEEALVATFVQLPAEDRAAILRYVKALAAELAPVVDPDEAAAEQLKQDYLREKKAEAELSASAWPDGEENMA